MFVPNVDPDNIPQNTSTIMANPKPLYPPGQQKQYVTHNRQFRLISKQCENGCRSMSVSEHVPTPPLAQH